MRSLSPRLTPFCSRLSLSSRRLPPGQLSVAPLFSLLNGSTAHLTVGNSPRRLPGSEDTFCSKQLAMDLDEVDYSDSLLADGSIWRSMFTACGGIYSESLSASFEDLTQSTDPTLPAALQTAEPSTWAPFSVPSPASLGFLAECLHSSPIEAGPSNLQAYHPFPLQPDAPLKPPLLQLPSPSPRPLPHRAATTPSAPLTEAILHPPRSLSPLLRSTLLLNLRHQLTLAVCPPARRRNSDALNPDQRTSF